MATYGSGAYASDAIPSSSPSVLPSSNPQVRAYSTYSYAGAGVGTGGPIALAGNVSIGDVELVIGGIAGPIGLMGFVTVKDSDVTIITILTGSVPPAVITVPVTGVRIYDVNTPLYTYLACDLRSGTVIAELPLRSVTFERRLNGAGTFRAQIPLGDYKVASLQPIPATIPSRTAIYVDRGGALVWGGWITTRRFDSSSQMLEIGGEEMFGYFHRRIISAVTYTAQEQLSIVRSLILQAEAVLGGNIGIAMGAETSPITRTVAYATTDNKIMGEAIVELSNLTNGFDFTMDPGYNSAGTPTMTLRLSYPRRGLTSGATGLVFDLPGNILDYRWPEDGTRQSTLLHAVGSGSGATLLTTTVAETQGLVAAGYPILEDTVTYKDVLDLPTLVAHATADSLVLSQAVLLPEVTVIAGGTEPLGSYGPGDEARFRIQDERFPDGLDAAFRIIGYRVSPGDGFAAETVTLTLGPTL